MLHFCLAIFTIHFPIAIDAVAAGEIPEIVPNFSYPSLPIDWENTTILDPLQNDITGLCTISLGGIFVPNSLFDRVGWWKITHQSFNYAKSISTQIYDTGAWTAGSLFRPNNITRTQVELGTTSETPSSGSSVSIDWIMPNGTIWSTDSVSSIVGGIAVSSSLTFGGMNTSAGLWETHL
jgi:hypothetical protein